MAHVSASIDIPVSPDEIWQLIGGFGSLPDWLSFMPTSELSEGGRVRRLANRDGETLVERLVAFDDTARSYSYSFLEAPFPVTDHLATLRVHQTDAGKGSRVEWFARFKPNGVKRSKAQNYHHTKRFNRPGYRRRRPAGRRIRLSGN